MGKKSNTIEINFLDHVAIRVNDITTSVAWYEKVLGLKKHQVPQWGPFPVFMLANKTGVAIFPANNTSKEIHQISKNSGIDHFAFNVNKENFEKAKERYSELNLDFTIQDHHYFQSIYTKDPDGHTVELTTLVVQENLFYKL